MAAPANILELRDVSADSGGYDIGLTGISLTLAAGDLAIVLLQRPNFNIPLADVASGLTVATTGEVIFSGRSWRDMSATRAGAERGRIGRIFGGHAWVSNLNVDENILLPSRYHKNLRDADLRAEADALAKQFGLPGLPESRPSATSAGDLHRAAAVRAFLGTPALLLLERPEHGLYPEILAPLLAAVATARQRGAAVLWLTNLAEVFNDPHLNPTRRIEMDGSSAR